MLLNADQSRPDSNPWRPTLLIRITFFIHFLVFIAVLFIPDAWLWLAVIILMNHLILATIGLVPRSTALGKNLIRLPASAAARNEITLTIDDGPDPDVTPRVLEILEQFGVKATFFCIGERAAHYPELCQLIIQRGHEIENHSQHHRHHFSLLSIKGYTRELQAAQSALTRITGIAPKYFRAPAGFRNPFLDPVLHRLNLQLVSWSVRGYDTFIRNPAVVKKKLLAGLHAGAILLLHDGNVAKTREQQPVILEALPGVLSAALASGLHFVTLRSAFADQQSEIITDNNSFVPTTVVSPQPVSNLPG